MDLFGNDSRDLLNAALAELHETRAALVLEQAKRIAAEALTESYRQQADRANELARKMEDSREEAVRDRIGTLTAMNEQLIAASVPKEDGRNIADVKRVMEQMPKSRGVNPLRKMLMDQDRQLLAAQVRARTGIPSVDKALDEAQTQKPN